MEVLRNLINNFKVKYLCWNYSVNKIFLLGGIVRLIIRENYFGNNLENCSIVKKGKIKWESWEIINSCLMFVV